MARVLLRPVLAVVMLSLVAGATLGAGPAPARAASQPRPGATSFPLTPELSLNADSDLYPNFVPGTPMSLVASFGGQPAAHFQEFVDPDWVNVAAVSWVFAENVNNVDIYRATYAIASPTAGDHQYRIHLDDDTGHADVTVHVALVPETVAIDGPVTVQAHHLVSLTASLTGTPIIVAPTGTIEWRDADSHALLAPAADVTAGAPVLNLIPSAAGVKHIEAIYSGDSVYAAATSPVFTLTITADTVQATGVGVDLTTFYPIVDGYRDAVHARGTRQEPIWVSIRIYNSTNHLVRSLSVATGIGAYSVGWNGRTSGGTLLPAGSYKIKQTLTDTAGTHKIVYSTVALSWKKIYTYSTTLNKTTPTKKTTSWAAWQFTLPSATIYKSLNFQIYGKSTIVPGIYIGAQDKRLCAFTTTYSLGCVASWTAVSYSLGWHGKSLSTTYNRSGRYVRGFAAAAGGGIYYKVRLLVTYGILK